MLMDFIEVLEIELRELIKNSTTQQYNLFGNFIQELANEIMANFDDQELIEIQIKGISTLAKEYVMYSILTPGSGKTQKSIITKIINIIRDLPLEQNTPIPTNSLLAVLYYFVDIIAGSSAMGRGTEESIIPEAKHNEIVKSFFNYFSGNAELLQLYSDTLNTKKAEQAYKILPLILDIVEITYASLAQWKPPLKQRKNEDVDAFYVTEAEMCMAKGSFRLLDSLNALPEPFKNRLAEIRIPNTISGPLRECSNESIHAIKTEIITNRRYRGGNSASAWISCREMVLINNILPSLAYTSIHRLMPDVAHQEKTEIKQILSDAQLEIRK